MNATKYFGVIKNLIALFISLGFILVGLINPSVNAQTDNEVIYEIAQDGSNANIAYVFTCTTFSVSVNYTQAPYISLKVEGSGHQYISDHIRVDPNGLVSGSISYPALSPNDEVVIYVFHVPSDDSGAPIQGIDLIALLSRPVTCSNVSNNNATAIQASAQDGSKATIEYTLTCTAFSATVRNANVPYIKLSIAVFDDQLLTNSIQVVNGVVSGSIPYPSPILSSQEVWITVFAVLDPNNIQLPTDPIFQTMTTCGNSGDTLNNTVGVPTLWPAQDRSNATVEYTFICTAFSASVHNTQAAFISLEVEDESGQQYIIGDPVQVINGEASGIIFFPSPLPSNEERVIMVVSMSDSKQVIDRIFETIAVCDNSTNIPITGDDDTTPPSGTPSVLCPDAPASYMGSAITGRSTNGGDSLRVRDNPGTGGTVVGYLQNGQEFQVIGGHQCANAYVWWQINANGLVGWVAEGNATNWFIKPVEATILVVHGTQEPTTYRYARILPDVDIWPLYAEPNELSPKLVDLAADEYYELLDGEAGWVQLRTLSGMVGWVDGAPLELGNFFAGQVPSPQEFINSDGAILHVYDEVPPELNPAAQFLRQQALSTSVQLLDTSYFLWAVKTTTEIEGGYVGIVCQAVGISEIVQEVPDAVELLCIGIGVGGALVALPGAGAAFAGVQLTLFLSEHLDAWLEDPDGRFTYKTIAGCPLTTRLFGQTPQGGCLP